MKRTSKKKENRKRKRKNNKYDNNKLKPIFDLMANKNFYKALSYIEDYINTNPGDLYGRYIKALILFHLEEINESKQILQMIELNCDLSTIFFGHSYYMLKGDILKKENKYEEMLECYKKAYDISPKEKISFSAKRILDYYIENNNKESALKFCEDLPNTNDLNVLKAHAYLSFNEKEKYEYYLNQFQVEECNVKTLLNHYYCLRAHYLNTHSHPYNALEILDNFKEKNYTNIIFSCFYLEEKIVALLAIKNYEEAYNYIMKLPEHKKHPYLYEYYMKKFDFLRAYQEIEKIEKEKKKIYKKYDYYYYTGDIKKAEEMSCKMLSNVCDSKNLVYFLNCSLRKDSFEEFKMKYTMLEEYLNKDDMSVRLLECFAKKETIKREKTTYSEKQIINYNKKKAIQHIKSHHGENSVYISYFNSNNDIEKIFNEISDYIVDKKPYYSGVYDVYIVHLNNIKMGSIYNKKLNDISIITLPNTKNILTMYPVDMVDEDLNDVEKEPPKTKRLSQIDKFNKKYQNITSNK